MAIIVSCLNALTTLADESDLVHILPFLEHQDFTLRIEAMHTVSEVGGTSYLEPIEDRLDDTNWWVRREAAQAIAGMGSAGLARLKSIARQSSEPPGVAARGVLAELQFNRVVIRDI